MDVKQKQKLMLHFTQLMIKKHLLKKNLSLEEEQLLQLIPTQLQMKPQDIFRATLPILIAEHKKQNKPESYD